METWLEHFALANFQRSSDTAHDLKTPLNVAVLNLELLRMRLRRVLPEDDEKIDGYTRAIETELRRMGRIFDAFFLLSTPPRGEGEPEGVDIVAIARHEAAESGCDFDEAQPCVLPVHGVRIRQALQLVFDGARNVMQTPGCQLTAVQTDSEFVLTLRGLPLSEDLEMTKVFKFYFSDSQGNPDLALATARLIVETYGGELNASQESDKVSLRMTLPLGER